MVLESPPQLEQVKERIGRTVHRVSESGLHKLSFHAMSTICQVNFQTASMGLADAYASEVVSWVSWFESTYSRFLPDSLISRINRSAGKGWVEIDEETGALFKLCDEMVFFTRGVFDPTALPLMRLWNWKAKPPTVPSDPAIAAAKELVGWNKVQRRPGEIHLPEPGMCLDLGGIGKEFAVDRVLLKGLERGITNILVDFGQDVRVHGQPPERGAWHIGLQDPRVLNRCWTGLGVTNHAVATSGDGIRCFIHDGRRYGHILDPRSGYPVNNGALSVSVIAQHCTFAGVLATAAFVLGGREGTDLISLCPGVEGCITTENARHQTRGFHAYQTS